jgi:hypothetical protein
MKVFIDTGAFLALANKPDSLHELTATVYQEALEQNATIITSNYIVDETITLIRARVGHRAAVAFIKSLDVSGIKVLRITEGDEHSAREIFIKYKDKEFSFTDCTCFALIDKHSIDAILSLDAHFGQYGYKNTVKHFLR